MTYKLVYIGLPWFTQEMAVPMIGDPDGWVKPTHSTMLPDLRIGTWPAQVALENIWRVEATTVWLYTYGSNQKKGLLSKQVDYYPGDITATIAIGISLVITEQPQTFCFHRQKVISSKNLGWGLEIYEGRRASKTKSAKLINDMRWSSFTSGLQLVAHDGDDNDHEKSRDNDCDNDDQWRVMIWIIINNCG